MCVLVNAQVFYLRSWKWEPLSGKPQASRGLTVKSVTRKVTCHQAWFIDLTDHAVLTFRTLSSNHTCDLPYVGRGVTTNWTLSGTSTKLCQRSNCWNLSIRPVLQRCKSPERKTASFKVTGSAGREMGQDGVELIAYYVVCKRKAIADCSATRSVVLASPTRS
jgi:hypothetical protein